MFVAPVSSTPQALPTTTIVTVNGVRPNPRAVVLCMLPDGTIGTRAEFLNYDRQQTVAESFDC